MARIDRSQPSEKGKRHALGPRTFGSLVIWLLNAVLAGVASAQSSTAGEHQPATPQTDESPGRTLELALCWQDGNHLLTFSADAVAQQVRQILEPLDVQVIWNRGSVLSDTSPDAALVRVVLAGEPRVWGLAGSAMGVVFQADSGAREVYIFYPAIARILGYAPDSVMRRPLRADRQVALARALGKVVAHEIFHAIAPSLPHAPYGLTGACLDREFLLAAEAPIHPYAASVLRHRLAGVTLSETPTPGTLPD